MNAKESFRRVGWALFGTMICATVVSAILIVAASVGGLDMSASEGVGWLTWLTTFLPIYLVAIPFGSWVLRKLPADKRAETPLTGAEFSRYLMICFPLMYGGHLIGMLTGRLLSLLLSDGASGNPLTQFASDQSPIKLLVFPLLAPVFEEWFFRRQLIGRTVRYGEKTAIVLSALTFALFHSNLYQFFYALGLGLLFSYIYVRTRRLRYSIFLHMAVNFWGSVIGPYLVSKVDLEKLDHLTSGGLDTAALPWAAALALYGLLVIAFSVAGLVLLVPRIRKLVFLPAEEELPKEGRVKTVYGNAGMILFLLLCLAMCIIGAAVS